MNYNTFKKSLLATFICCIYISNSGISVAETQVNKNDYFQLSLEELLNVEISVASQFVESALQVGSTVSTVSEAHWQEQGARRLSDVINTLPGTIVLPVSFGAELIQVRGYGFRNNSNGIATLWDGVSLNSLEGSPQFVRQNIQLGTLDRIEMIRGPGSALYGESAFHGVLAMHAFESETDITRVKADYASNGYYEAGLKQSMALTESSRLHIAIAGSGQPDQDRGYNYIDPTTNQSASSERGLDFNNQSVVLKVTSDPKRKQSYYAGIYIDKIDYDDFYSTGTSASASASVADRDVGGVDSTFTMLQGGVKYDLNSNIDAHLKLYYIEHERTFTRAFSQNRDFEGVGDQFTYGANYTIKQSEFLGHTQWSLDFGARRSEMNQYSRKVTLSDGTAVSSLTGPLPFSNFTRDIYNVALDASTSLNNKVQLRYGGRYDDYSDFGEAFSPRLGLVYQPVKDTAIKLLYGQAFRAPSAGEVKGFATIEGGDNIQPETIDTYELVFMKETAKTLSEFVLFKSQWKEAIVVGSTTTPGKFGKFINSGNNSAHGAEASFTWQADPWNVVLSGSYVRSKNDTTQEDYNAFPKWILNAGMGYYFSKQKLKVQLNNRVHLDAAEGQSTTRLKNPEPLKDYWRTDLHLSNQYSKKMTLTLDVRNLFDRENFFPSIQSQTSTGGLPDEPFSIKIGILYKI